MNIAEHEIRFDPQTETQIDKYLAVILDGINILKDVVDTKEGRELAFENFIFFIKGAYQGLEKIFSTKVPNKSNLHAHIINFIYPKLQKHIESLPVVAKAILKRSGFYVNDEYAQIDKQVETIINTINSLKRIRKVDKKADELIYKNFFDGVKEAYLNIQEIFMKKIPNMGNLQAIIFASIQSRLQNHIKTIPEESKTFLDNLASYFENSLPKIQDLEFELFSSNYEIKSESDQNELKKSIKDSIDEKGCPEAFIKLGLTKMFSKKSLDKPIETDFTDDNQTLNHMFKTKIIAGFLSNRADLLTSRQQLLTAYTNLNPKNEDTCIAFLNAVSFSLKQITDIYYNKDHYPNICDYYIEFLKNNHLLNDNQIVNTEKSKYIYDLINAASRIRSTTKMKFDKDRTELFKSVLTMIDVEADGDVDLYQEGTSLLSVIVTASLSEQNEVGLVRALQLFLETMKQPVGAETPIEPPSFSSLFSFLKQDKNFIKKITDHQHFLRAQIQITALCNEPLNDKKLTILTREKLEKLIKTENIKLEDRQAALKFLIRKDKYTVNQNEINIIEKILDTINLKRIILPGRKKRSGYFSFDEVIHKIHYVKQKINQESKKSAVLDLLEEYLIHHKEKLMSSKSNSHREFCRDFATKTGRLHLLNLYYRLIKDLNKELQEKAKIADELKKNFPLLSGGLNKSERDERTANALTPRKSINNRIIRGQFFESHTLKHKFSLFEKYTNVIQTLNGERGQIIRNNLIPDYYEWLTKFTLFWNQLKDLFVELKDTGLSTTYDEETIPAPPICQFPIQNYNHCLNEFKSLPAFHSIKTIEEKQIFMDRLGILKYQMLRDSIDSLNTFISSLTFQEYLDVQKSFFTGTYKAFLDQKHLPEDFSVHQNGALNEVRKMMTTSQINRRKLVRSGKEYIGHLELYYQSKQEILALLENITADPNRLADRNSLLEKEIRQIIANPIITTNYNFIQGRDIKTTSVAVKINTLSKELKQFIGLDEEAFTNAINVYEDEINKFNDEKSKLIDCLKEILAAAKDDFRAMHYDANHTTSKLNDDNSNAKIR